jgi:hypothetical protein
MGKIIDVGEYKVEEAESFHGIRVWALHLGTEIILFNYMGKDAAADRYFFKARNQINWILVYTHNGLFSQEFHPFLLDLDKITLPKEEENANV